VKFRVNRSTKYLQPCQREIFPLARRLKPVIVGPVMSGRAQYSLARDAFLRRGFLLLALLVLIPARPIVAQIATPDPVNFFTNLSSRLLQKELGLPLTQIQIHPTNQYTPAVHRLLQVTANLWESTTDEPEGLPTVFCPRFHVTNGIVFLSSYALVTNDAALAGLPLVDLTAAANAAELIPASGDALVFGVPLVIGARKGLPNFNEFSLESIFQLTRKLQLRRSVTWGPITETNQFFVMSLTTPFGVEFWNSYSNDFTRAVDIFVTNRMSVRITNDLGVDFTQHFQKGAAMSTNNWPRFRANSTSSFLVPLRTNLPAIPAVGYLPGASSNGVIGFVSPTNVALYDTSQNLFAPRWGVTISNRLHAKIVDQATGRIIDHVLLNGLTSHRQLTDEISDPPVGSGDPFQLLWATNALPSGYLSGRLGAILQINISLGNFGIPPQGEWQAYGEFRPPNVTLAIQTFRTAYHSGTNTFLEVPFSPVVQIRMPMLWQVNDPLVRQLATDMFDNERSGQAVRVAPPGIIYSGSLQGLGYLNERYRPWPASTEDGWNDPYATNPALKDPLMRASDNWDFPSNAPLDLESLGRIHRGTPWQTICLKSADVALPTWQNWTGHIDPAVAQQTHPRRDWSLITTLQALLNTNAPQQLLSVNDRNPINWMAALDGLNVLTNIGPTGIGARPEFEMLTIASNSWQALLLAEAIAATRANQPGQVFRNLGELFATAQLSLASPWLNPSTSWQQLRGMTDRAYEIIPAQLLSRVRSDSVGEIQSCDPTMQIQFSGYDGFPYAVEHSLNLSNWTAISTNYPTNGVFQFDISPATSSNAFYRSVLLP
jgi:hypothetical protein